MQKTIERWKNADGVAARRFEIGESAQSNYTYRHSQ